MFFKPVTAAFHQFLSLRIPLIIVFVILYSLLLTACSDSKEPSNTITTTEDGLINVRLGTTQSPPSWLVHIALEQGFFKEQGLNVNLSDFKSGKRALKGMFSGQVDLATTAEGPVVFFSLIREDFSIITTIGIASNDNLILARKDSGINSQADLKGKAIATQVASSAHYYLHLFLTKNNFTGIDIIQSYMDIEKLPDAVVSGVADAIATREPYFSEAKARLGDNAIVFETPGLYLKSFLLAGSRSYIKNNPEIIFKFVSALLQAEYYVKDNKDQSVDFLVSKFELTKDSVNKTLQYLDLSITLDQLLISKLQDEANWILESKLTEGWSIPNYIDFIDTTALLKAKPAAMTITGFE